MRIVECIQQPEEDRNGTVTTFTNNTGGDDRTGTPTPESVLDSNPYRTLLNLDSSGSLDPDSGPGF
jgi:hypothetical protein